MQNNSIESILKAQNGNEQEMTRLLEDNKRSYMEYSKKILW